MMNFLYGHQNEAFGPGGRLRVTPPGWTPATEGPSTNATGAHGAGGIFHGETHRNGAVSHPRAKSSAEWA
jgi:hypothetical protein